MPEDTVEEKQAGFKDCNKCKYSVECIRFQNDLKQASLLFCKLGVK